MTTYYVGPGGNDGNNGQSWANRKLTLNGAEDIPVAANDVVYVGPGIYREQLTVDVSGSSGQPITYIGDVTGEHTDGVGGIVRITGSDNDQTATRANVITASSRNYRTFRGFTLDLPTTYELYLLTCTYFTIEDCVFHSPTLYSAYVSGLSNNITLRRCMFFPVNTSYRSGITFSHSGTVDNVNDLVSDCIFVGGYYAIDNYYIGGVTVKNCLFLSSTYGVRIQNALTVGQTMNVYNCVFENCAYPLRCTTAAEGVEDYNTLHGAITDRTTWPVGANSKTYPALLNPPLLLSGFKFPWYFGELSEWSQVARIAGTSEAADDFHGMTRPATSTKKSWGAIQYDPWARSTAQAHGGSVSRRFSDAARHQIRVPVTNVSTTFTVYVYREANYAGTAPQMVIKQPGQSDTTITDTGAAGQWNKLETTLTPAASPLYAIVELVSNNTATTGSYSVYFDDLKVT